jgi:hypothetical protein
MCAIYLIVRLRIYEQLRAVMHIYIYIYIYIHVCVCARAYLCVWVVETREQVPAGVKLVARVKECSRLAPYPQAGPSACSGCEG